MPSTSEIRTVIAGVLLFVTSTSIFYIIPAYLEFLSQSLALDTAQLGNIAGAESISMGVMSLFAPFWAGRFNRRSCALFGAVACIAGNMAAAFASTYQTVLIARVLVGFFGEGMLCSVAFAVLGNTRDVSRTYAIALTAAVALSAAVIAASAVLTGVFPMFGPLVPVIATACLLLPFIRWLPLVVRSHPSKVEPVPLSRARAGILGLLLVAQALWTAGPIAFWTFAAHVARNKDVSGQKADLILAISVLASLLGSLSAAFMGDRWGQIKPLALTTVAVIIFGAAYQLSNSTLGMMLYMALFYGFWNYGAVYKIAIISRYDPEGRAATAIPAAQVLGMSIGPLCAGHLMMVMGSGGITIALGVFTASGLALYGACASVIHQNLRVTVKP